MSQTTDAVVRPKLSPPQLAALWGVSRHKIIGWIRSGELRAINAATNADGERPRYLVDADAVAAFERARSVVEPKQPTKRRRPKPSNVVSYF